MIREATDENWNFSRWSYNYHCGAIVALGHGIVVPIVRFLLDQSQSQMIAVFIYYFNCISFAIRLSGHKVANWLTDWLTGWRSEVSKCFCFITSSGNTAGRSIWSEEERIRFGCGIKDAEAAQFWWLEQGGCYTAVCCNSMLLWRFESLKGFAYRFLKHSDLWDQLITELMRHILFWGVSGSGFV